MPGRTKPLVRLAEDLGISRSCLQNWTNQAADDKTGGERLKEPAELRRRNRQLELDNNILKRAAARRG